MSRVVDRAYAELVGAIRQAPALYAQEMWGDGNLPFSRNRKLGLERTVLMLCAFGGGSLLEELSRFRASDGSIVAKSSFIEARSKIEPEIIYSALVAFTRTAIKNEAFLFKGRRLIGVDGTDINTYLNKSAPSFMPVTNSAMGGYNQYKATTFIDLLSHEVVDLALQPISKQNEESAAAGMLAFPVIDYRGGIIVGDRLYGSSYSFLADLNEYGVDFVLRTKNRQGSFKILKTVDTASTFDMDFVVEFGDSQAKALMARPDYVYVNKGSKRGIDLSAGTRVSRFSYDLPYRLKFRAVSVQLTNGKYELLLTSLPREEFSASDIEEIYKKRWNIELSYRNTKYACSLAHMHSKKEEFSQQEIYAAFLLSSFVWRIVNSIDIPRRSDSHRYAVNYKQAVILVKEYLRTGGDSDRLIEEISRFIEPIRPDRASTRALKAKGFVPFVHRIP